MGNEYYELLGVEKNASEADIKKSYKKLAMQYHPDRNKEPDAEDKFKKISEAYQVLSDPQKRQQYDMGGQVNFEGHHPGNFQNPFDIFEQMFNMGGHQIHINGFGGHNITTSQTTIQHVDNKRIETTIETRGNETRKRVIITDLKTGDRYIQI